MTFYVMPECPVCLRQDDDSALGKNRVHNELCAELVAITGSIDGARKVLGLYQSRCEHPTYHQTYEYLPGLGRDHWWWCTVCFEVAYGVRPAWAKTA